MLGTSVSAVLFYNSIFRMSKTDVIIILKDQGSKCDNIKFCKLLSGDILIRRHITPNTSLFNLTLRPYFTHTAFYEGNGRIIEAIGNQKKNENEIKIIELSKSDWTSENIESFVVIRPNYPQGTLTTVTNNLEKIANDSEYRFGLPQLSNKQTNCSDMIFRQLEIIKLVNSKGLSTFITPDYLFWNTSNNQNYKIVFKYTS